MAEIEDAPMAYWYNLSWVVKNASWAEDGTISHGKIERIDDLAFDYEMESVSVKTKKKKEEVTDIYGDTVLKKNGKPKKKKQQYVKTKLKQQSMTFKTVYQVATGTYDILDRLDEIRDMIGNSAPLVIGREFFATDGETGESRMTAYPRIWGKYYMQLTKVGISGTELDELGRLRRAEVSFTLEETTDKEVKKVAAKYPSQSAKNIMRFWVENPEKFDVRFKSAAKAIPDKNVKAMLRELGLVKKKKKKKKK